MTIEPRVIKEIKIWQVYFPAMHLRRLHRRHLRIVRAEEGSTALIATRQRRVIDRIICGNHNSKRISGLHIVRDLYFKRQKTAPMPDDFLSVQIYHSIMRHRIKPKPQPLPLEAEWNRHLPLIVGLPAVRPVFRILPLVIVRARHIKPFDIARKPPLPVLRLCLTMIQPKIPHPVKIHDHSRFILNRI